MFFLKKIIASFLSPLSLVLELYFVGLLLLYFTSKQKLGKLIVLIGFIIFVLCSYTPTSDILIEPLKSQYPTYVHDASLMFNQMPKLVVVLGSGYDSNSSLPIVSRIGHDSLVRLIEGIRIYRMMPEGKLVLSGGNTLVSGTSAQDMAQLAKKIGVYEKDIIIESKSRDTEDEARIINSMVGDELFILVTSSSHMPRAMALFTKLGMNPIPAPTRAMEENLLSLTPNPFFPSSINLQKAEMAFHEYLGIIWAKFRKQI